MKEIYDASNMYVANNIYIVNIDSLFLINFVMNLYLYMLAARTMKRTATRLRLAAVSFAGALVFCMFLLIPGIPAVIKRFIGPMMISIAMSAAAFRLKRVEEILHCTGYIFAYAFLFGGLMKFLFASVPFLKQRQESVWCIMGTGILGYQAGAFLIGQIKRMRTSHIYQVKLIGYGDEIVVAALSDTGNSLREPVSGKPVSVIEEKEFIKLEGIKAPEKYKLIPYHSVGKDNGLMEGYEIPEVVIESDTGIIRWQKVIVGISRNRISADGRYQMILHPDLCDKT